MKVKELREQLENQPDDYDAKLFVGDQSYDIVNVGITGTVFDSKTKRLKRPPIVLIDGK